MTSYEVSEKKRQIDKLNRQRMLWLKCSSIVYIIAIYMMFGWNIINDFGTVGVWRAIISLTVIICTFWWYWIMSVIRCILTERLNEIQVLDEITVDLKLARKEIKILITPPN